MATTVAQAFNEFKDKIKLTSSQEETVRNRRQTAHNYLASHFDSTSTMPLLRTTLIGSAQRDTIIRPLDDIDILAVFENKEHIFETYRNDSFAFINRVRNALNQYEVQLVGTRGQAVRLFYQNRPHVDIAPVFKWSTGGYGLPDGSGGWITTDPDFHLQWINTKNQELNYRLNPIIRMIKRWNNTYETKLKSFHLEMMVANTFTSLGNDSREALEMFFDSAPSLMRTIDPSGRGGDLSVYLTATNRQLITNRFNRYKNKCAEANRLEINGNHRDSIEKWREIFGNDFPTYG